MSDLLSCLDFLPDLYYASRQPPLLKKILLKERQYKSIINEIWDDIEFLQSFEQYHENFKSFTTLNQAYTEHYRCHRKYIPSLIDNLTRFSFQTAYLRKKYSKNLVFMDATDGILKDVLERIDILRKDHSGNEWILTNARTDAKAILLMFTRFSGHAAIFIDEYNHYITDGRITSLQSLLKCGGDAWLAIDKIYEIIETPNTFLKRLMANMLRDTLRHQLVDQSWLQGLRDFHPDRYQSWIPVILDRVSEARKTASSGNNEFQREHQAEKQFGPGHITAEEQTFMSRKIFSEYKDNVHALTTFITRINALATSVRNSAVIESEFWH